MENTKTKSNWLMRIGFGSGDLAQNLIYQTICMYLLFFYTDIYGLNPGMAATMFLVVRLIDVLWDPLVGTFIDKHNPRWGKYRSYLILAGLPLTVLAILCFWNGFSGSLLYAYITYIGLSMCNTLINVPYGALNSSLTPMRPQPSSPSPILATPRASLPRRISPPPMMPTGTVLMPTSSSAPAPTASSASRMSSTSGAMLTANGVYP